MDEQDQKAFDRLRGAVGRLKGNQPARAAAREKANQAGTEVQAAMTASGGLDAPLSDLVSASDVLQQSVDSANLGVDADLVALGLDSTLRESYAVLKLSKAIRNTGRQLESTVKDTATVIGAFMALARDRSDLVPWGTDSLGAALMVHRRPVQVISDMRTRLQAILDRCQRIEDGGLADPSAVRSAVSVVETKLTEIETAVTATSQKLAEAITASEGA